MRKTCCSTIAAAVLCTIPVGMALSQEHGGHGAAEERKSAEQTPAESAKPLPLCPVMGEPVHFNVRTMTDDGPVYFCCESCIKKFKAEPRKFEAKLAKQRAALEKRDRIQVNCPITGNPIDGKTEIVTRGRSVSFCCARCVSKFDSADNSDVDNKRLDANLEGCFTYQTRCPVSEEKVDPTIFTDLPTGQRIYLCCSGCSDKLRKAPAKYAKNLAAQGIPIDPEKVSSAGPTSKKAEPGNHKHP